MRKNDSEKMSKKEGTRKNKRERIKRKYIILTRGEKQK